MTSYVNGADKILEQMQSYWLGYDYNPDIINCVVPFFSISEPRKIDKIKQILNDIIIKHNNNKYNLPGYKDDTNIIIFVLDHIVIKIYHRDNFDKIKTILSSSHINIETVLSKYDFEYMVFIVNEKITPLLTPDCKLNITKEIISPEDLYIQISAGLKHIHKLNFLHNDISLDNIGFKIVDKKIIYVLFDFGASKLNYDKILFFNEFTKLRSSINRYL